MCFVSYIPVQDGYLLGSNRDENRLRKVAIEPQKVQFDDYFVLMPRDGKAGGTWIAARNDGYTAVLLNGAFVPHVATPPYRHSRGAIIPQLMGAAHPDIAMTAIDLEGIEPFTLLIAGPALLREWRWDGKKKFEKQLDAQVAHCRSSVTLYNPHHEKVRESWFQDAVKDFPINNSESLFRFHSLKNMGERHFDILVERPDGIQTVSTTVVSSFPGEIKMEYCDYLDGNRTAPKRLVMEGMQLTEL